MRPPAGRGVPLVDGAVELHPRVGAGPGGLGDGPPQVARLDGAHHPSVGAGGEAPVGVVEHGLHELVADPHRVVGVLAGDGLVGLAVEVGGVAGGDERPDLVLLLLLPVDELLDVGMVDVEDDHLGGAPGGAARLDGPGGAVADLQERHDAGGAAAARQGLVLGADAGEVGAGARPELEEAGLPDPQVHDAALVDQVVFDRLDEAGVGGGAGVGVGGGDGAPGDRVHVPEALGGAGEPVGVVQAGVEPLWAVGGGHLVDEHVAQFVLEGAGVGFGGEVAVALGPPAPGGGEAAHHLAGGALRAQHGLAVVAQDHPAVGVALGDSRLAEVLGDHDVGGHLGPRGGDLGVLHLEDHRAVGIGDARVAPAPLHRVQGILARFGEEPGDAQSRGLAHFDPPRRSRCLPVRWPRLHHNILWQG